MALGDVNTRFKRRLVRHSGDQPLKIGRRYLLRVRRAIRQPDAIVVSNPDQRWLGTILMSGDRIRPDQAPLQHIGAREREARRVGCIAVNLTERWSERVILPVERKSSDQTSRF